MLKALVASLLLFVATSSAAMQSQNAMDEFDRVLREHVNNGFVDYPAIGRDLRFSRYIDYLAEADPEAFSTEAEKLAFWINAYNALAIQGILDGLSPDGFFGRVAFFATTDFRLAGRDITLYDLEHDIIIPFAEPRIHFAIVCASASCPILQSEAYRAETLDEQLDRAARQFINDESKNQFNDELRIANLSKIFDWFDADFEKHAGSVANYLKPYVDQDSHRQTLASPDLYIRHLDYDWSLNGKALP